MAAIQDPRFQTVNAIYAAYEKRADSGFRPHLGASLIGHHCERHIWLSFRFAKKASFPGRVLRLFRTGQLEEDRIVHDLRAIGCEVHAVDPSTGKQFTVSAIGGHFGGSLDAAAKGIPEAPNAWHCIEMKTHSQKSFDDLIKNGVQKSKPQHYAQMTVYMGLTGMERALYFAVNKNTDELYTERVKFDRQYFDTLMAKAERLIYSTTPPPRISNDPAWYECKFCTYHPICHGTEAPLPNCRTCAHSTPIEDGKWQCARHNTTPTTDEQIKGCGEHRYIPVLLETFATPVDGSQADNWVRYENKLSGKAFTNGLDKFSSTEIHACQDKAMLADDDETINELKQRFDAQVVG